MRWRALALIILVGIATWQWATSRPLERRPGEIAPDEPLQVLIDDDDATPIDVDGFRLTPRARFTATVRILSTERYRVDPLAPIAPFDLAVGWGPMSDTALIDQLTISQGARFYTWSAHEMPASRATISEHSANWHIVPANDAVLRRLEELRPGEVVRIDGVLIDIDGEDGGRARTSLRRDDTGAGACEIIRVESIELATAG